MQPCSARIGNGVEDGDDDLVGVLDIGTVDDLDGVYFNWHVKIPLFWTRFWKSRLIRTDPTIRVDNPPRPKNDGFAPWTEDDVAAYERRWPIGTRQRVWFDVLIYAGLRRGNAVHFGRPHVRNGVGSIKTQKTDTEVTLPILPVLAETLKAGPCGDLTFIAGESGRPLTKESFGNLFRKACGAALLK